MSLKSTYKSLPKQTKKLLNLGIILALLVALPLFIWSVVNMNFDVREKANEQQVLIDLENEPFIGNQNSPVTIVMYSDFQCEFCKSFIDNTLSTILSTYPTEVKFVHKDFPISTHALAQKASLAGQCAYKQNKFWEMHSLIFDNQDSLTENSFSQFANTLNLDITLFDSCMFDPLTVNEVDADINEGSALGVVGTPTFFINNQKIEGAQPFSVFKTKIDYELSACKPVNKKIVVSPNGGGSDCHNLQEAIDIINEEGITIELLEGDYVLNQQVNISNKQKLLIKGQPNLGNNAVRILFASSGFGFIIQNSSGSIEWATINGSATNGLISIQGSSDFDLGYLKVNSDGAHAIDIQNSNNISIYNLDIQSAAGAVEVSNSNALLSNNVIHDSDNAVSYIDSDGKIASNLIYNNKENAIILNKPRSIEVYSNTVSDNCNEINDCAGLNVINIEPNYTTVLNIYKNIFANNSHGVKISSFSTIDTFNYSHNDVWNNRNSNYSGLTNQTETNGNIASNPLFGENYCVYNGSPVLYGVISQGEYMGNRLYCSGQTTLPTATALATSSSSPTSNPTVTPTSAPEEPNSCGGTCGSNYNCKANLYCYQGYCRNPICSTSANCDCTIATASPTITSMPNVSPKGAATTTNSTPKSTTKSSPKATPNYTGGMTLIKKADDLERDNEINQATEPENMFINKYAIYIIAGFGLITLAVIMYALKKKRDNNIPHIVPPTNI